ncbi:hypothetical protein Tco_1395035 [Tanacetum coccineum]
MGYDWSYIAQDEPTEFALTAYTSNSLGSDTELGLEYVEAQLVVHQKNEAVDEEKIAFLEFEVKDKSNAVTRLKNQLDKTLREKYDLKAKLEQFETSFKNLNKLINSQLSAKDKIGLRYGDQLNENDSSGSKLFNSVFDSCSSDGDDNQTNDRPTANKTSASVSQVETSTSQTSNTSVEMSRVKSVRPSGVIIKDWRMAKKSVLKNIGKNSGHREIRPVWNSAQRINHQNKFVPSAVFTRFGRVPVSAAKQSSLRATTSTSTFRPINTATHTNRGNVSKLRTNAFHNKWSAATPSTPPTTTTIFGDEDLTIAQTLVEIRSEKAKEKEKGVVLRDEEEPSRLNISTTTLQPLLKINPKDKGKGVLVEEEPEKQVKIKRRDQGLAQRFHKEELAEKREREREQFTIKERAQFLVETIAAQRKFRVVQRAAEIRSKPPTKTQLRNLMMTYLKNMGGYKHSQLKGKTYEEIHGLYERQQKRIQDFTPMDSEKEAQKSGKRFKRVA